MAAATAAMYALETVETAPDASAQADGAGTGRNARLDFRRQRAGAVVELRSLARQCGDAP